MEHLRAVELPKAYRLLNHGPTVLVSTAHAGERNVMAAAWAMPLDFDPPKVLVVIDKATHTRGLIEQSGVFALNVPSADQVRLTWQVGSESGSAVDKFARHGISTHPGTSIDVPLIDGCLGYLECRVIPEPRNEKNYDLFIGEVVAASADDRVFGDGRWHFPPGFPKSIHHIAHGVFFETGAVIEGNTNS
ncbi:MAG: flavin reductase family protein [Burkholderiales bacterium]|nr:flavin reductase family protein [Burkholderiales bacterium]